MPTESIYGDLGEIYLDMPTVNSDMTIYALWGKNNLEEDEIKKYTVTFNTNGGSEINPQTVSEGGGIPNDIISEKSGYIFNDWCFNSDGTESIPENFTVNGDITVYANWKVFDSSDTDTNLSPIDGVIELNVEDSLVKNDYVDIPIVIDKNSGISKLDFSLEFDGDLLLPVSYSYSEEFKKEVLEKSENDVELSAITFSETDNYQISLFSDENISRAGSKKTGWSGLEDITYNGVILTVKFKVKDTVNTESRTMLAAENTSNKISTNVSLTDISVFDESSNAVRYTSENGTVILTNDSVIKIGDIDGKDGITANDAACLLQKVLNMGIKLPIEEETNDYMKYADVSGDGKLTAVDAAMILQKALHEDFVFPVEK